MSVRAITNYWFETRNIEFEVLKNVQWSPTRRMYDEDSGWEIAYYNHYYIYRKKDGDVIVYEADPSLLADELNVKNAYIDTLEAKLECMPCDQTWTDCQEAVANEIKLINNKQ